MTPIFEILAVKPVAVPDEISTFKLPVRLIPLRISKSAFTASQLLFGPFGAV